MTDKEPSYLLRLSQRTKDILQGRSVNQAGAICFRSSGADREVLLITSRDTGRWVIPKGTIKDKESPRVAAAREAREEAGVSGKVSKKAIGHYTYLKGRENIACVVSVFLIEVKDIKSSFRESSERQFEWMAPVEASKCVAEPELKTLFLQLI